MTSKAALECKGNETFYNVPIDTRKELSGTGRGPWKAPEAVQQKVVDIIIEEARKQGFNTRDTAYYLAIAKRESTFNPDAANECSTASGVAQVVKKTGESLGITDKNRFDARSSVRAGLEYFKKIKQMTVADYGSAAGDYEPLIYNRYHYGEHSTQVYSIKKIADKRGKKWDKEHFEPKPMSVLRASPRYADSKTVVDEAVRIEKILNASHGLVVQLNDVLGKPLGKKTVLIATQTPKSPKPPAPPAPAVPATPAAAIMPAKPYAPAAPPAGVAPAATGTTTTQQSSVPPAAAMAMKSDPTAPAQAALPSAPATVPDATVTPADGVAAASASSSPQQAEPVAADTWPPTGEPVPEGEIKSGVPDEWEITIVEATTDENGNLPEVITESGQPFVIMIPRLNHEEYNDAVSKNLIAEFGNEHRLLPHDGEQAPAPVAAQPVPKSPAPAVLKPAPAVAAKPKPVLPAPPPPPPPSAFTAAAAKPAPKPSQNSGFSFADLAAAIKKQLGWGAVYPTSFAYVKQLQTRPKFAPAPLADAKVQSGSARVQVIGSSLPAKTVNAPKVEAKVTTAVKTAVQPVAIAGDASWMPFAIQEQNKKGADEVIETVAQKHRNDPDWKKWRRLHTSELQAAKDKKALIKAEQKKKIPAKDAIQALRDQIAQHEKTAADADKEMLLIEPKYNNQDILKYLRTVKWADARDEDTPWCASFVNWCLLQAGIKGTNNAGAESYVNWGEEISEPKYGAITVVKRGANSYHVGFFTGITNKSVSDGYEEIESTDKQGKVTKTRKKKSKTIKMVRLLSGNMSERIRELSEWVVDPADGALHLVSYRWPTSKEKI